MNMTNVIHKDLLESGSWFRLSLFEQMANIGSDVERTIQWRKKGDMDYSRKAFDRALELFDFTIADPKNRGRLKEVVRAREFFADFVIGDNQYGFTDEAWQKYFYNFGYAAALQRGR